MSRIYNLPSGKPFNVDIRKNVGNALTGPNPQPAPKTAAEARERAMADLNKFAAEAPKADILKYDKPYTFNSDVTGQNFERYYSHPKFKKLAFSPFRDNETVYNQNSSLWDDTQRAAKYYPKLAGLAVSGTFGNWDDMFSGRPDVDNAIEMENYTKMATSSREGFGAKALNFGVNSAYTVGIIGSILTEEAALGLIGSTGIGSGVAAAGTMKNILKLGKAFDRLADVFRTGSNINEARKTWDAIGKVSRAVLPFQNTADIFRKSERVAMGWDKMDDYAKAYKSFGAFYRDLREINLVTSEAKLEGGFVQNEVANDLIKEFRAKEGRDPNDDEAKEIYDQALKAGYSTSYANMAGIYASNKVVLDKMLKGLPGLGQLEHAASKSVRGSLVKNTNWLKEGKNPFELMYGAKKFVNKEWLKQAAKNAPKSGLRYMAANLMEGTQEVYQEATAEAMKKYYMDTYYDPSRAHQGHMLASIQHGLKSQMSGRGLETFLSGALMAGPIQVAGAGLMRAGEYANLVKLKKQEKSFSADPKNAGKENPYTKKINEYKEWDNQVLNSLNELTKNKKEVFSKLYRNNKEQKDLADLFEDAVLNDDTKTAVDSNDDSLFAHIDTLRRSGSLDLFKEQLQGLSELSNEELAEAFNEKDGLGVDSKNISQRIETVLKRIDDISSHLEEVNKIANPYDAKADFFNWFGFEEARKMVAYNDYTYKRVGNRMTGIQEDIKNIMASAGANPNYSDIAAIFNVGRSADIFMQANENMGMTSEIELLKQEIENLKGATEPELVKRRERLEAKQSKLAKLSVLVQNYTVANKLMNPELSDTDLADVTERIETAEKLLYDGFKDYIQNITSSEGTGTSGMFEKTIDQLFAKYKDYWRLDADKSKFANAINMLYNPELYQATVQRYADAAAGADQARREKTKEAVLKYKQRFATNDFLNDLLSQYNVFVSEEDAEAYLNNDIVPSKFINADTGLEIDPRTNAELYNNILDLIDKYDEVFYESTGNRLFKPTREDVGARIAGVVTGTDKEIAQLVPEFQSGDKRTLSDLAAEYGFDKGRSESQVRIDTVLNAILNNKLSTPAQKELARKLMTLIDKSEVITFKSNHSINSSYDAQNGIIVDPRYSSSDYQSKVSVPLEYSILNAAMQKVILDSLSDSTFDTKITELRQLAVNASNDTQKLLFKYALANNQTFLAELLTNGDLQEYLAKIEYTGETTELSEAAKSAWSKFLDILSDLLKNILNFNTSLYREAMAVTLNKLSQPSTGTSQKTQTPPSGGTGGGSSPIDVDKQDAELMAKLREKYDAIIAGMSPEDASRMNFDSWMMSDSRALEITRKHKADKIRQQAAGTQGGGQPMVGAGIKRNVLSSIGFTMEEINAMTEEELEENYNNREELAKNFVVNLNSQDWGEVDRQMKAAKEKAASLNLALTEDGGQYIQYDENGNPIPGTERERVSHVVKEPKSGNVNKVAAARGNIIDALYKQYLSGDLQSFDDFKRVYKEIQKKPRNSYINFSDEMLQDLFDIVRNVQRELNKKGLKVIPDFPIISGMLGNIPTAGEMDILAYNKAGKVFIIDMKSSYTNRRLAYDVYNKMSKALGEKFTDFTKRLKENDYFIKKTIDSYTDPAERALIEDRLDEILNNFPVEKKLISEGTDVKAQIFYVIDDRGQQLGYKELLRQTTGLQADSINIFPIITGTAKGGVISQAQLEKEIVSVTENEQGQTVIKLGGYSIPVDNSKTIYDLNLPKVTQTVTTYPENPIQKQGAPTVTDIIADDIYNNFVDNNIVPQDILDSIADKVMKRETLSQRETAIFNGKTSEINEIIKKKAAPAGTQTGTAVQGDIEKEKASVTSSEFAELKRLAKFFLENPKEPTVLGSVVTRYPALFEAITKIEKERQEALDKLKDKLKKDLEAAAKEPDELGIKVKGKDNTKTVRQTFIDTANSSYKYGVNRINAKYDTELAALEGDKEEATKTYDNKPIAKSLQGKVIYITPDSYTVGDMATHSENVVLGSDLVKEALLELDINSIKSRLEVLAQDRGKIGAAAEGLLKFIEKNGITPDKISGRDNFLYKLAILEREGDNSITSIIYSRALSKAKAIASSTGKTVVFDTPTVLSFEGIDLAILNSKSDFILKAAITPSGKTGIADKESLFNGTKKRVMTDSSESILTGGPKTVIPKQLKDIRAFVNSMSNKQDYATKKLMLDTARKTGLLDELLAEQNMTYDQYYALIESKRDQIAAQLSIGELVNKGENVLVKFLNKKGEERVGLIVGQTEDNKLEIKDVTDEYNGIRQGNLFVDVDDLSYGGLGSKAKSLKLAERDVNERVISIIKETEVTKAEGSTKKQSDSGQDNADQSINERKESLKGFDPFNKEQQENNNNDLFSCGN